MGWNNRGYDNRNGYNNRGYDRGYDRGYNNDRGYDRGYNNQGGGYNQQNNLRYEPGTKCTLTYNPNKTVIILRCGREQYECRDLETLRIDWFYEHELEAIQE